MEMGKIFIRVGQQSFSHWTYTAKGKVSSYFYKYSNEMPQQLHTQYSNLKRFENDAQRKMRISCARVIVTL